MKNVETLLNRMPRFPRGVPFINHGSIHRDPAELIQEFLRTHTAWVEVHLANDEVLARPANHLPEILAEAAHREVDARLIGLTAAAHRRCAGLPTRNIYAHLRADEMGPLLVPNHQRCFLEPALFDLRARNNLISTLDAADYTHRLPEIYAILKELPEGPDAQALQRFGKLAELYGLDDQLSQGKVRGHFYESGKEPQPLGEEDTGIILLAPPAIAGEQEPASRVPVGPAVQLDLNI